MAHQMQPNQVVSQCLNCGWFIITNALDGTKKMGQLAPGAMWLDEIITPPPAFEVAKTILNKEGEKADPDKKKFRVKKAKDLGVMPKDLLKKEYLR